MSCHHSNRIMLSSARCSNWCCVALHLCYSLQQHFVVGAVVAIFCMFVLFVLCVFFLECQIWLTAVWYNYLFIHIFSTVHHLYLAFLRVLPCHPIHRRLFWCVLRESYERMESKSEVMSRECDFLAKLFLKKRNFHIQQQTSTLCRVRVWMKWKSLNDADTKHVVCFRLKTVISSPNVNSEKRNKLHIFQLYVTWNEMR